MKIPKYLITQTDVRGKVTLRDQQDYVNDEDSINLLQERFNDSSINTILVNYIPDENDARNKTRNSNSREDNLDKHIIYPLPRMSECTNDLLHEYHRVLVTGGEIIMRYLVSSAPNAVLCTKSQIEKSLIACGFVDVTVIPVEARDDQKEKIKKKIEKAQSKNGENVNIESQVVEITCKKAGIFEEEKQNRIQFKPLPIPVNGRQKTELKQKKMDDDSTLHSTSSLEGGTTGNELPTVSAEGAAATSDATFYGHEYMDVESFIEHMKKIQLSDK